MKTQILNVNFDVISKEDALNKLKEYINSKKSNLFFTPNPEMVMMARKNKEFEKILNSGDLVVPDGIGIVLASKLNKVKIKERVPGCDLTQMLLREANGNTVYILGSKEENVKKAVENIEKTYKGVKVVGYRNGYFTEEDEKEIVENISKLSPDILLIGLGMVKQESFAYKYKDKLNAKVIGCVGGTIDVLSGNVKRAPDIFIKFGMEWFYRLISDPRRIGRMMQLPLFAVIVVKEKIVGGKS